MSLNFEVKAAVIKMTEIQEGRIPHLYLDTRGFVTVGIGHLISSRASMASVVMYKKDQKTKLVLASLAEKQAEYDLIKKQLYGLSHSANYYKKYTNLFMKDSDMVAQKEKHILTFYNELTKYYSTVNGFSRNFDTMPHPAQKALFDMIFNFGMTKLKNQHVKMNNAIKKENWSLAASESNRLGISESRNSYVKNLFLSVKKHQAAN